jgi:hypothetical protein
VPALQDDIHDVLVRLVRRGLAGGDAHAEVGCVEAALDGLVEREAHGRLDVAVPVKLVVRKVVSVRKS